MRPYGVVRFFASPYRAKGTLQSPGGTMDSCPSPCARGTLPWCLYSALLMERMTIAWSASSQIMTSMQRRSARGGSGRWRTCGLFLRLVGCAAGVMRSGASL